MNAKKTIYVKTAALISGIIGAMAVGFHGNGEFGGCFQQVFAVDDLRQGFPGAQ